MRYLLMLPISLMLISALKQAVRALCELYERLGGAAGIKDIQSLLQIRAQQYPYGVPSQTAPYSPQGNSDTSSAVKLQQHSILDKISQTAANQAPWDPSSYGEATPPDNSTSRFPPTLHSRNTSGSMGGATLVPRTQSEEPPTSKGSEDAKMYSALLQDPKPRKSSFFSKFMMRTPSNESNGRPSIRRSKSDNPSDALGSTSRSSGSPSWSRSGSPYDESRPVTQVTVPSKGNLDEITENVCELEGRLQDDSFPNSTLPIRTISRARTDSEVMEPHYSTRLFHSQQPPPAPLILPSASNNYGGFCEGAWRMQIGDRQGGMKRRQDVGPGASTYYFWKCMSKQCAFSGSMYGTKKAPSFDTRVRKSKSGIRFRWSFLAKSHVAQAKVVNGQYNYGCIFCCTGPEATPVFGGIDTLLEHLLTHKGQGIPAQVLQRAGCVVDRLAGDDEEFDLNVPPFAGDDGQVITF